MNDELANNRTLGVALVASVAVHIAAFALLGSEWGQTTLASQSASSIEEKPQEPTIFVEIDPNVASEKPDRDTEFYSNVDSKAANPNPPNSTAETPSIDGENTEMIRLEDVPEPTEPTPLTPKPDPTPTEATETAETTNPVPEPESEAETPELTEDDLAFLDSLMPKPSSRPSQAPSETPPSKAPDPPTERPRTLAQARRQLELAGEKTEMEGGVDNESPVALVDSQGRSFGDYDRNLVLAVQSHWYSQLRNRTFSHRNGGLVRIQFRLHEDGNVSRMTVASRTVDAILSALCETAIQAPAPYGDWPQEMRQEVGQSWRDMTFTFYYH